MKFTKASIDRLTVPKGKSELIAFDDALPGFGLRLRSGGKRTFIVQYRLGAKQRRVTVGATGILDLDEARKRAKSILAKVQLGTDPQQEKSETKAQASNTLATFVETYLSRYASDHLKPRTYQDIERYLRRLWKPLGGRPARGIERADVALRLAHIAGENGPYAANRARAALSSLYSWAIAEGLADRNPVAGTRKAVEERARDRVLSDAELGLIWHHAGDGDFARIIRLLILTGQRREEVAAMKWSEVDLAASLWRIGSDRTKNNRAHDVPIPQLALDIIKSQPRVEDRDLVFGVKGPFSGWSKSKIALDARIGAAQGDPVTAWRLHDIRRTVATRLSDIGVLPHVVEAILNHISGHKAGVAGIYNRSAYSVEKAQALRKWSEHIASITRKVL